MQRPSGDKSTEAPALRLSRIVVPSHIKISAPAAERVEPGAAPGPTAPPSGDAATGRAAGKLQSFQGQAATGGGSLRRLGYLAAALGVVSVGLLATLFLSQRSAPETAADESAPLRVTEVEPVSAPAVNAALDEALSLAPDTALRPIARPVVAPAAPAPERVAAPSPTPAPTSAPVPAPERERVTRAAPNPPLGGASAPQGADLIDFLTTGTVAALRGEGAPVAESVDAVLLRFVRDALAQGQDRGAIDAHLNRAHAERRMSVPQKFIAEDGRVNTAAVLAAALGGN